MLAILSHAEIPRVSVVMRNALEVVGADERLCSLLKFPLVGTSKSGESGKCMLDMVVVGHLWVEIAIANFLDVSLDFLIASASSCDFLRIASILSASARKSSFSSCIAFAFTIRTCSA